METRDDLYDENLRGEAAPRASKALDARLFAEPIRALHRRGRYYAVRKKGDTTINPDRTVRGRVRRGAAARPSR
jgi:hypothetical protein